MSQSVEATFDGHSFRPTEPVQLPANTRVRLVIEPLQENPAESAIDPYSFLAVAREANIDGPADWSQNVDKYLYGDRTNE